MGKDVAQPTSKYGGGYFINNSKEIETSEIDMNAGGFLKHKAKANVGEKEKAIPK